MIPALTKSYGGYATGFQPIWQMINSSITAKHISTVATMHRLITFLLLVMSVAGCQTTDPQSPVATSALDQVPAEIVMVKGRYDVVAACSFKRLNQTGLRKSDVQGEARLVLESSGARYWELRFRPTSKGTEVAFSRVQTLPGPLGGEGVLDTVRACGAA